MRFVDLNDVELEAGWMARAEEAARNIVEVGASVTAHQGLWQGLKGRLSKVLHDKCWFCETPVPRSDNAVDHFRPKGRVADATDSHDGYSWLSFELRNFRFACTFCNSRRVDVENGTAGGKADRFPLLDENARVYSVEAGTLDYGDLLSTVYDERPTILDPCEPVDWQLLGCRREDGCSCATSADPEVRLRVATSIEVYHLNHDAIRKQRHTAAGQILERIREAKAAYLGLDKANAAAQRRFARLTTEIYRMIRISAPYSGEMHFLLRGQRSQEHPWIEDLLVRGG